MVTIQSVCNEVIKRAIKESIYLSPLKLQKIIYFVYAYGLEKYKKKLFNADFYAWKFGPVCESIYHEFKGFGNMCITKYSQDAQGVSYFPNWESSLNDDLSAILNLVWNKYKNYEGSALVDFTHKKGSAWAKTRTNQRINDEDIVKDIKDGLY